MSIKTAEPERPVPVNGDVPARGSAASGSRTYAWGITILLVGLYVVNYADKAVLGIIAQPLKEELGLTSAQIGMVGSLFFLTFTIGGFFAGALNRMTPLKWALVFLCLAWAVVMLPFVFAASFAMLVVCRMLLGFFEGPSQALVYTAVYSWHDPTKRGLPGALLTGSASLAKMFIAPLLTLVTVTWGWRWALIALTVVGVLWCLIWIPSWRQGPFIAEGRTKSAAKPVSDEPSVPWIKILLSRTFISGVLVVMAVYALTTIVMTWLPSYFEKGLGYSRLEAGSLFSLPSVVALAVMLVGTIAGDRMLARGASVRLTRIVIPAAAVIVSGVILLSLPMVKTPILAVIVLSIGYGFALLALPMFNAAVVEICPPQQTAGTLGFFLAIMAIGGLIAPYAAGVLVDNAPDQISGYLQAFQWNGGIAAAAGLLALLISNPDKDRLRIRGAKRAASVS